MKNQEIAHILYEIGIFLEMKDIPFKPYAYQKAAIGLDSLEKDVEEIYNKGGRKALEDIPGVGESIAEKIEEYLKTGRIKYYNDLKKKMPIKIEELTNVEGIGAKTIKTLYKSLRIRDIQDLEKAARGHKIRKLASFGEKSEENILQAIAFLKKSKERFLLGDTLPQVNNIIVRLKSLDEVKDASIAGSIRRMKETIGDVDILVVFKGKQEEIKTKKIMDFFVSMPEVIKVLGKGSTRSSVRTKKGFDIDLRLVPEKSYGSALQYFTGSKEHNIAIRKLAIEKGLKLNEYGLFRGRKAIAGKTEQEVYNALGMDWPAPELRENQGEVEAALRGVLPKLVELKDIKGDLHCHSRWSEGNNTIQVLVDRTIKLGYQYVGISDHTKALRIENGLDERELAQQAKKIVEINRGLVKKGFKFRVLQGAETNILRDGSIDINNEALKKLDYVITGIHSSFKLPKSEMTERIIKAIKNPYINIISHPSGRVLGKREKYDYDFDKILRAAKEFGKVLEINSHPARLDLNDQSIRMAKETGVKMIINTDTHNINNLQFMEFGVNQAKRGWAENKDIINTKPLSQLLKIFK